MMAQADSLMTSFVDALWPVRGTSKMLRAAILAFLGSALLTLSAKVQVPFYPVPMTMQTLVVLLVGMAFGARLGVATVALYLAEGAAGLPVFAGTPEKGIGLAYMMGPTGGYLLGFVLAAAIAGWMVERRRDAAGLALAVVAGSIAIYGPGVLWLARFVGAGRALELGLVPFLGGDLLKAGLAFTLALCGAAMVRRRHGA
jgi:biotin transport system substrate-specific component